MPDDLDPVWKALSDPTRRAILDLLRQGPRRTTEIVGAFPHLSRFGVMKHMDVLREASLINTREEGRQRVNSLNAVRSAKDLRALGEPVPRVLGGPPAPPARRCGSQPRPQGRPTRR